MKFDRAEDVEKKSRAYVEMQKRKGRRKTVAIMQSKKWARLAKEKWG